MGISRRWSQCDGELTVFRHRQMDCVDCKGREMSENPPFGVCICWASRVVIRLDNAKVTVEVAASPNHPFPASTEPQSCAEQHMSGRQVEGCRYNGGSMCLSER